MKNKVGMVTTNLHSKDKKGNGENKIMLTELETLFISMMTFISTLCWGWTGLQEREIILICLVISFIIGVVMTVCMLRQDELFKKAIKDNGLLVTLHISIMCCMFITALMMLLCFIWIVPAILIVLYWINEKTKELIKD